MGLWCKDLPVVQIPQSSAPKRVTFVIPYYENPQFLRRQLGWWSTYPAHVVAQLTFLVVDDGSPEHAAREALRGVDVQPSLRVFRIEQDVRWNWLAARNIGAHHAVDGWLLLTDIDHVVPANTAEALVYGQHDAGVVYAFQRREHTGQPVHPHSASFFMTREMFWTIGGYDERLSGYYGSDGLFRRRVAAVAPIEVLSDRLIRHEFVADASTTHYQRKQPEDATLQRLAKSLAGPPKTLSYPYHEVALREAVPM